MVGFLVIALCSMVEVYQRFRGTCCLYHQDNNAVMKEAARTSKMVNFYQITQSYNPEDNHPSSLKWLVPHTVKVLLIK
jgi:hypothetical protein